MRTEKVEAPETAVSGATYRLRMVEAVPLTADECLREMWETCDELELVDAGVDQWWVVWTECPHGKAGGNSAGPIDVSTAFRACLKRFREIHTAPRLPSLLVEEDR